MKMEKIEWICITAIHHEYLTKIKKLLRKSQKELVQQICLHDHEIMCQIDMNDLLTKIKGQE